MNNEIYTWKQRSVGDCVKACTLRKDAWYIPDIQRHFVWNAKQTLLLIDSLFRGWPFGVLTIETVHAADCGTIPPRAFVEEVDPLKEPFESKVFQREEDGLPEEYSLVLDGQQRLQSLILAFGSKKTKYIQDEESWYWQLLEDRPRKAYGVDYEMVRAMLALDFEACYRAYQKTEGCIPEIRFSESGAICYAFVDANESSQYQDNPYLPFPVQRSSDVHLRLSRLWKLFDEMSEMCQIEDFNVEEVWQSWGLNLEWIKDLNHKVFAQSIICYLYKRVYLQNVSYIELKCPEGLCYEVFQNRVVEIFTRLNKGGTQLTIEEITSAWLKNAWKGKRSLDEVVSTFRKTFSDRALEIPDFIRFISALWTIEDVKSPERKVIQNRDLTNSQLLGQLAIWFSKELKSIQRDINEISEELSSVRWLWNEISAKSFVLAVVLAYRRRVSQNEPCGNQHEKAVYDKKIGTINLVRFMANSHWSGYWSADSIGTWAKKWAGAIGDRDIYKFNAEFLALQLRLSRNAKETFETVKAGRNTVHRYYLYLQVWHRLDQKRFNAWKMHMKGTLDVDHCYAFARWEKMLGKLSGQMTEDERNKIDPIVNSLGNCILLERPKNIAKKAKSMQDFFDGISELERDTLLLTHNIIDNDDKQMSLQSLKEEIEIRDQKIRREINDFIEGRKDCVCG